jgi:hypothetical protein
MTPRTLYAGMDGDGVFKSMDGAGSWQAVNNGLTAGNDLRGHVWALAIDPTTPSTLYAGTCSEGGIFKSTGGAGSWRP